MGSLSELFAGVPQYDPMPVAGASGTMSQLAQSNTQAPDFNNLSLVQRAFLGVMRGAEGIGAAGTSLKLYNDIVQRGRNAPITESDFTPDELSAMQDMVKNKMAITGQPAGHIDYRDYPGGNLMVADRSKAAGEVMNTLGGFNYSVQPNGAIGITDKYDFNASRGDSSDDNPWAQALAAALYPRNLAASIGRRIIPDTSGRGVPVNVTIGLPNKNFARMQP
jgi:hypothetical protein